MPTRATFPSPLVMRLRRLVPYLALAVALLLLLIVAAAALGRRASPAAEAFTATCPLAADRGDMANRFAEYDPVSYTHLTLPTILLV